MSSRIKTAVRVLAASFSLHEVAGCHRQTASKTDAPAVPDSVRVAYGTQAPRDMTGAVGRVDSTATRRGTAMNLADLLEGRVPGLEVRRLPNGRVSLRIRGDRSINSNNEPLIVLDGVPMSPDNAILQDLDPREVASISVLKDAGSLAAYGSRGANGVILITTKK